MRSPRISRAPAEELEERRAKLRALIKLGKDRGFLTYAEINDHLPDDLNEAEAIESIISTFNDMGVAVYEQAPDAETLLLNDNAPAASSDDEVEEEAEVALSTVDSEFGRTTDPVRMYMREMGTVELLTREGEIEIAKRIEDGLKHMVMAISACPTTIAEILAMAERVANDEMRIDELVDGLMDENAEDADGFNAAEAEAIESEDEEEEEEAEEAEEEDDGAVAERANAAQLEKLRVDSLAKFASIGEWFDKMRRAYEKEGYKSKAYLKAQETIQTELMSIRFTRAQRRAPVRHAARAGRGSPHGRTPDPAHRRRQVRDVACRVHRAFPEQRDEPRVGAVDRQGRPWLCGRARPQHPGDPRTAATPDRPAGARRPAAAGPQGNQPPDGGRRTEGAPGQARDDRGQPASRDLDREEVHEPRAAVPRPDPGRQYWPDEGGGQVRISSRLQVLDVCDVVDSGRRSRVRSPTRPARSGFRST